MVRGHERAGLLHMRAENVSQRGVQQVRSGMIAHIAMAALGVRNGGDAVTHIEVFFRNDAMRDESGDGVIRAANFGDFERFGIVVEAARVRYLSAGFRVDRCAVEDDLGFRPFFDFVYRTRLCDDGLDAAVARIGAKVKVWLGPVSLRKLRIHRIRGVFVHPFPGSLCPRPLLFPRAIKAIPVDFYASTVRKILDQVALKTVGVIESESLLPAVYGNSSGL